jgi:hypothetical protein
MINIDLIDKIDELNDLSIQIHKELYKMISNEMQKVKEIIVPENIYDYDISYSVSYDGGNHPEYDSDCFACIEKIELDEERIIVHTEYGSENLEFMPNQDLFTIAYLIEFITNKYDIFESERE